MGLRKINDGQFRISPEEWQRRQMRRHNIKQWTLTIIEILLLTAFVVGMWQLFEWASSQIHP